jgi:hypothetical protein
VVRSEHHRLWITVESESSEPRASELLSLGICVPAVCVLLPGRMESSDELLIAGFPQCPPSCMMGYCWMGSESA